MNQHEADMELAFAHARSKDKVCGICMEVVMVRHAMLIQIVTHHSIKSMKTCPLILYTNLTNYRINLKEKHVSE